MSYNNTNKRWIGDNSNGVWNLFRANKSSLIENRQSQIVNRCSNLSLDTNSYPDYTGINQLVGENHDPYHNAGFPMGLVGRLEVAATTGEVLANDPLAEELTPRADALIAN